MIPPPAQHTMSARIGATVVEAAGSHSIYVSQPQATADLIKRAAREACVEVLEPVWTPDPGEACISRRS